MRCPICNSPDIEIFHFTNGQPSEAFCHLCGSVSKTESLLQDEELSGSALRLDERKYILSLEERIQKLEDCVKLLTERLELAERNVEALKSASSLDKLRIEELESELEDARDAAYERSLYD